MGIDAENLDFFGLSEYNEQGKYKTKKLSGCVLLWLKIAVGAERKWISLIVPYTYEQIGDREHFICDECSAKVSTVKNGKATFE